MMRSVPELLVWEAICSDDIGDAENVDLPVPGEVRGIGPDRQSNIHTGTLLRYRDASSLHPQTTCLFGNITFPNLHVLPVDMDVALQTANIRAFTRLSMPDAILTASALLSGSEAIITNDRDWQRRLSSHFPQFRWLYLAQ